MDLNTAKRRLENLFKTARLPEMPGIGTKLAIYGAGGCGRDAWRVLKAHGYQVVAFLDKNSLRIKSIEGTPCFLPISEEARQLAASGVAVLIGVFNFTADTGEIQSMLEDAGFQDVLPYYALYANYPHELKSRFWLETRNFWEQQQENFLSGLALWSDDESRSIYLDLVELRLTGNLKLLRNPDREHQYFPADIPPIREPVRLIDGGAYTGDSLAAMQKFKLECIAAFEPDPENFRLLRQYVSDSKTTLGNVTLFPCGLDSDNAFRCFSGGNEAASAIATTGGSIIQVVALDDVLPQFAPTFIKLDIEGAEIGALRGATEMITTYQPRIAACIYHMPGHLWEVPILLKELLPKHRLFLRYHGFNGFDAVAYAVEP